MRMWNVPPKCLCRKHLIAEHCECHMYAGAIRKKRSIRGHIEKGQVETHNIQRRHDELAKEMLRRGYNHNSPLNFQTKRREGKVDSKANLIELSRRCKECRKRIAKHCPKATLKKKPQA
ncbi:hypothetical protein JW721_02380 [Candidatus Micrarchaeota archaeon]|nr:hypothetical protein [Candidatus Micrarchaeota archaeon]